MWKYEDRHPRRHKPMQNLLLKLGFKKCGIIYIADGSQRVAFQKEKKVIR